jgi:hypothetical protein
MSHVPTGQKLSLQVEGKLHIINIYLEDDEQNHNKSIANGSQDEQLEKALAYQARSRDERLKPKEFKISKSNWDALEGTFKLKSAGMKELTQIMWSALYVNDKTGE